MTRYPVLERLLPGFLRRYILDWETRIENAVSEFGAGLSSGATVLDAGAGEARHGAAFEKQRYTALDLAVGDAGWDYSGLDCVGDLARLPFAEESFDACLNIVTLEHVPEPQRVVSQIASVLKPGGRLLCIVPHAWEVHQSPHDYFRYTRHGIGHLLERAGFEEVEIAPAGGYFRLLSRRLLNGLQFFPKLLVPLAALLLAPPALLLPLLEPLDREKNFTLGYLCTARKPF